MVQIFKLVLLMLRELIFTSKDEYNLNSAKFNPKKVALFLFLLFSVAMNEFIAYRLFVVSRTLAEVRVEKKEFCADYKKEGFAYCAKKVPSQPSDDKKPAKTPTGKKNE